MAKKGNITIPDFVKRKKKQGTSYFITVEFIYIHYCKILISLNWAGCIKLNELMIDVSLEIILLLHVLVLCIFM